MDWFYKIYFSNINKFKPQISSTKFQINYKSQFFNDHIVCDFEFWSVSSSVGQACLDSKNLQGHLIDFVKNLDGKSLKLDDSSGYIETIF